MISDSIHSVEELERRLSEPTEADRSFLRDLSGDIVILGAGGKMGPSLAKLAKRAAREAGASTRVVAVSRFTSETTRRELEAAGVATIALDLLNPSHLRRLPDFENVLYLAGRKFGSAERPDLTWAMNAITPALAAYRYRQSRVVVFSTGNVYGLRSVASGGSREDRPGRARRRIRSVLFSARTHFRISLARIRR